MGLDYTIVCDSREQKKLWTKGVIVKKLDVGDYSIEGFTDKISIERKSLPDAFQTLGKGHARFKRELERAADYEYFAIVIEGSYSSCKNKDFDNSHYSRMRGYVITSILFTLHVKYGIPIFFTNGRFETKAIIKEIFNAYMKVQKSISKTQNI